MSYSIFCMYEARFLYAGIILSSVIICMKQKIELNTNTNITFSSSSFKENYKRLYKFLTSKNVISVAEFMLSPLYSDTTK